MTFEYEVYDDSFQPVTTLRVKTDFSPYTPAFTDGRPEECYPAEGGEFEGLIIYLGMEDITDKVDAVYGEGTYDNIVEEAKDLFQRDKNQP